MKKIYVFIASAMMLASCGAPCTRVCAELEERQNWEGAQLYGDIASISATSYELAGSYGRTVKVELMSQKLVEFNQRGDVLLSTEYDIDSTLIERHEYRYDERGYLAEYSYQDDGYKFSRRFLRDNFGSVVERDLLKADGTLEERHTITYDNAGNVVADADFDENNQLQGRNESKYGKANKLVETKRYARSGELVRRDVYTYDAQGRTAEIVSYDVFDNLEGRQVFTYGENGRDNEKITYDARGAIDYRVVERYDERGNLVELSSYDDKGLTESFAYVYDDANRILEEKRLTSDGLILSQQNFKYNDNGLLIEYVDDDKFHGQYSVTTYRYDDKNNLVEEMSYSGVRRVPEYVVEYVINYR